MPWISKDDLKWSRAHIDTLERERRETATRQETALSALTDKHDALVAQESAAWRVTMETYRASHEKQRQGLWSRISELETRVQKEHAEYVRGMQWAINMLMRRAQTHPIPTEAEATKALESPASPRSSFSFEDIGKAQAIREEGLRLITEGATYTNDDIEREVKAATGMTLKDLRLAEEQLAEESQSVS